MSLDLCVPCTPDDSPLDVRARLEQLSRLGYVGACLDTVAVAPDGQSTWSPPGPSNTAVQAAESYAGPALRPFHVYQRLTVVASDPISVQAALGSSRCGPRGFDVIAVRPANDRVLQLCCTTLDADIISLDLSQFLSLKFNSKVLATGIKRGLRFEVCYAQLLRGPFARRNVIVNVKNLLHATRGKGILVTGGAQHALELRALGDVASLCSVMGMKRAQTSKVFASEVSRVLRRGQLRKHALFRGTVGVPGPANGHGAAEALKE